MLPIPHHCVRVKREHPAEEVGVWPAAADTMFSEGLMRVGRKTKSLYHQSDRHQVQGQRKPAAILSPLRIVSSACEDVSEQWFHTWSRHRISRGLVKSTAGQVWGWECAFLASSQMLLVQLGCCSGDILRTAVFKGLLL